MTRRRPPSTRTRAANDVNRYPPIGDYALIGDCHSAALVSRRGAIDWCCMPRFDSASCFGRLLDWDRGGSCSIWPTDEDCDSETAYVRDTMVLETHVRTSGGDARMVDCFTVRRGGATRPYRQLLRIVEGVRGRVEFQVSIDVRFDYGEISPWLRLHAPGVWSAIGGNDGLEISGDWDLDDIDHQQLAATATIKAGQRVRLSIVSVRPEDLEEDSPLQLDAAELDRRLDQTVQWWRRWAANVRLDGPFAPAVRRSALVLKALTNAPTGAVVAAPTTSLPEALGAARNWDYRFSWIRDSQFSVRALGELGRENEADGFRRFVERSAAGAAESLQIMYGPGGERRLTEIELDLDGYRGSTPVRVGNSASHQLQLDVYGEVLDLAWRWHQRGRSPDDDYWRFLLSVVDTAAQRWSEPDQGLWELRGEPRHFVHSKVMCWAALDRGIRLATEGEWRAPLRRWKKTRDEIRHALETQGYDEQRGVFVQSFGTKDLDAALLLLPSVDFVAYDDERMIRTIDAVREELDNDGLLMRYRYTDELRGAEGVFVACTFWLVECLTHQGRVDDAHAVFERAMATANHLGLFAEEYDPHAELLLGNYPQGLSHLSHITAAVALAHTDR